MAMSRILSCFLFFVISIFNVHCQSASLCQETGAGAYLYLSRFQDAYILPQTGEFIGYGITLRLAHRFGISLTAHMETVQVSSIKDGYFYRGYVSLAYGLSIFLFFPGVTSIIPVPGKPYFDIGIKGGFAYNKYAYLEQYFIQTNVGIEPQLRFPLVPSPSAGEVGVGFPLAWYFRNDLNLHACLGVYVFFSLPLFGTSR